MPQVTNALLSEVHDMNVKLDVLSKRLNIGHRAVKRLFYLTITCVILAGISLGSIGWMLNLYQGVNETQQGVKSAQLASCTNRNESAKGSLGLWTFVLDASEASNRRRSVTEQQFFDRMREYIATLYAARDCSDLNRKYPIPKPPTIPQSQQ